MENEKHFGAVEEGELSLSLSLSLSASRHGQDSKPSASPPSIWYCGVAVSLHRPGLCSPRVLSTLVLFALGFRSPFVLPDVRGPTAHLRRPDT